MSTVREYGQYCPVNVGSQVLGDRWSPLILREMVALGSTRFNEIERGLPGISRTLLSQRLQHLERKGILERVPSPSGRGSEYLLTEAGRALESVLTSIGEWAVQWMYTEPTPAGVDPTTLTWWMHRRVDLDKVPDGRTVIEFAYTGPGAVQIWLVIDRGDVSVCQKHPGFDTDLLVRATPLTLSRVWNGIDTVAEALAEGTLELEGPPALRRGFATWFLWSPFATLTRQVTRAAG